jgi:hypothetical protein
LTSDLAALVIGGVHIEVPFAGLEVDRWAAVNVAVPSIEDRFLSDEPF